VHARGARPNERRSNRAVEERDFHRLDRTSFVLAHLLDHLVTAHGEKYLRYELSLAYAFLISYTKGCLV
jgi:hypothetical protein